MSQKILAKFIIRVEQWQGPKEEKGSVMLNVYTKSGDYIGTLDDTVTLLGKYGILPESATSECSNCTIGKSFRDGKWYGWSHRAIQGFGIGDKVEEDSPCASSGYSEEYLKTHPEEDMSLPVGFVAKTEEDCKRMAIAFAESVS